MDITPLIPEGRLIIEGYGGGGFRVSGEVYDGSVLITSGQVLGWSISSYADFSAQSLFALDDFGTPLDILLVGSGEKGAFLPSALRQSIKDRYGLVVEVMDTGAACRTYNVLTSEDRAVAAALIAY